MIFVLLYTNTNSYTKTKIMKQLFILMFIFFQTLSICFAQTEQEALLASSKGNYLGAKAPTEKAALFAPGIINTGLHERDITISPDLKEIYYGVTESPHNVIVVLKQKDEKWQLPEIASFSGKYNVVEAQFSPDGKRIWFASNMPITGKGEPKDYDLLYVEKKADGWSKPVNPGKPLNSEKDEFYPSITNEGTVYFTSYDMKLYRATPNGDKFNEPMLLCDSINSKSAEYNAFVAADESYIIFTSHGWKQKMGRGDLFISFNKGDDNWTTPYCFGDEINSPSTEMCPYVSPDGKYLFFASMKKSNELFMRPAIKTYKQIFDDANIPGNGKFDIYWIEAGMINTIKNQIIN